MANEADGVIARLDAWLKDRFGPKVEVTGAAGATFTEADVKRIAGEAVTAAVAPLQASIDAQKAEFAEQGKKAVTSETSARAAAAIAKVKASGRWVPAFDKQGLPLVFAALATSTTAVEFGEGAEKKSLTPLDAFTAFMEQLPKIVPTGDVYTGQRQTSSKVSNINDSQRAPAGQNSVALHEFAEKRSRESKISYGEALTQVTAEHPELTLPGGSAAGAV